MNRIKIRIGKSKLDRGIEILTFVLILISVILIAVYYNQLPEKLPIYFNWPSKNENGFGEKDLLWISPIICTAITIVFYKLNQYPWIFNYPIEINEKNAEYHYTMATRVFRTLAFLVGLMGLVLTLTSILYGLGYNTEYINYLLPLFPVLLIGTPIFYVVKMLMHQRNSR